MATLTVYAVAAIVALVIYYWTQKKKYNLPKGPWAWPVIGNLLEMQPFPHVACTKWAKKYGDIYTMYFGKYRTVVLSDPKLVREAFNDPILSGRPNDEVFTIASDGPHGLINSEGQEWVDQRRFTLRHLRDFGFGKTTGEELITNEMKEFIQGLEQHVGKPFSVNRSFGVAVLNTLWMILSGVRYEQDDPRLWSVIKQSEELARVLTSSPIVFIAPKIAAMFPKLSRYDLVSESLLNFRNIAIEHVNRHKEDAKYEDHPRDFIDAYLKEISTTEDVGSSFYKEAGIRSLVAIVGDLFQAGADTTSNTLSWMILYLSKFPHAQDKLHAELDDVVGKSRNPTLEDRPKMPYAEAIIAESTRMSSIVPNGVLHKAMEDVKFHGYDIPKGTMIMPNVHCIHRDPRYWDEPEEFRPERFLSEDWKTLKKHDAFMPFSVGKRQCLGETLARDTIFLYFTNIFHRFSIHLAEESKDATLEPAVGFLLAPQDYKVILQERV